MQSLSWTRLTDTWVDTPAFYPLAYSTRWHYLAMIQHCSRNSLHDGVMRLVDARRASDVAEPNVEVDTLIAAELVERVDAATVRLIYIADHVPSQETLDAKDQAKVRMRRHRKHKAGDHSECQPDKCPEAGDVAVTSLATSRDRPSPTQTVGTGQDGPGQEVPTTYLNAEDGQSDPAVVKAFWSETGEAS